MEILDLARKASVRYSGAANDDATDTARARNVTYHTPQMAPLFGRCYVETEISADATFIGDTADDRVLESHALEARVVFLSVV